MRTKTIALAALLGAVTMTPAIAQEAACIRPIRIFSMEPINNKTIKIVDRQKNEYTVHMRGTCVGMDRTTSALGFRYMGGELGCVRRGDRISYSLGTSPRMTCFIDGVTSGAPAG